MASGNNTAQTSSTSAPSNAAFNTAATTLGNQLNTQLGQGVKPYTGSMVPTLSSQTQAGVSGLSNNPLTGQFTGALGNTIDEFGAIAAGQRNGEGDTGWNDARDQAMTDTSALFTSNGRFGSGSHAGAAARGLASVDLARLQGNETRQMQAASMLPGFYQASQLPAAAQLQAGQVMDGYNTAQAADKARIFDATQNAGWNTLQRGSAIFGGTAPVSGTTQTNTQPAAPWWQGMLSAGLGAF